MSPSRFSLLLMPLVFATCGGEDNNGTPQDTQPDADAAEVFAPDTTAPADTGLDAADTQQAEPDTRPDTTPADTAVTPDTSGPDGGSTCDTFGCPCSSNKDCLDELCIEGIDGQVCTRTCIADCPDGFECLQSTSFGPDPISVCVPRHTRLCRPCRADADCQSPSDAYPAYCLPDPSPAPAGSAGSFCGSSCATRPCPDGFTCEDVSLPAGGNAKQCVPSSGECACRPSWAELGFSTSCDVTNTFGTCEGARSCGPAGLSPCLGPQATPEVCDSQDNDCDGTTDELEAAACYVTNANGSCPGTLVCGNNGPTCAGKEPLAESCNGEDDNCNGSTDELTCNDNLACTTDSCAAPFQCANALVAGHCLINGACHLASAYNPQNACELCDPAKSTATWSQAPNTCVIGGQCYPANTTNPQNACQICLPNQTTTAWSTASNTCQIGGQCYGANQANPLNACEICSPVSSTTTWTQALNTCNIQGKCYAAGVPNPSNPCLVCDPSRNATGWSNASNTTACDDGNACSGQSFCNGAGACVGDTSCNDGVVCTVDSCDPINGCSNATIAPGYCRINNTCYTNNTANPANPCQRCNPNVNPAAWSPQPTSVSCSDGNACTNGDYCDNGSCKAGPGCNDGLSCTTDTCNPSVGCSYPTQPDKCRINDACYADNNTRGGSGVDVCYECEPTANQSNWTFKTGKGCNDGNSCTQNDVCGGNACGGTFIVDNSESNDAKASAKAVANVSDCDDLNEKSLTATIFPTGDEDWFRFRSSDDTGCDFFPDVQLSNIPPTSNLDLEVYFTCGNGETPVSFDCKVGSRIQGQYGCRSANTGTSAERVTIDVCCTGGGTFGIACSGDDSGNLDVRVYKAAGAAAPTCEQPYTLSWGDD